MLASQRIETRCFTIRCKKTCQEKGQVRQSGILLLADSPFALDGEVEEVDVRLLVLLLLLLLLAITAPAARPQEVSSLANPVHKHEMNSGCP